MIIIKIIHINNAFRVPFLHLNLYIYLTKIVEDRFYFFNADVSLELKMYLDLNVIADASTPHT